MQHAAHTTANYFYGYYYYGNGLVCRVLAHAAA